jgi:hypothetical protein
MARTMFVFSHSYASPAPEVNETRVSLALTTRRLECSQLGRNRKQPIA